MTSVRPVNLRVPARKKAPSPRPLGEMTPEGFSLRARAGCGCSGYCGIACSVLRVAFHPLGVLPPSVCAGNLHLCCSKVHNAVFWRRASNLAQVQHNYWTGDYSSDKQTNNKQTTTTTATTIFCLDAERAGSAHSGRVVSALARDCTENEHVENFDPVAVADPPSRRTRLQDKR